MRSINPRTPKPDNCFELLSDWLLATERAKTITNKEPGYWGLKICTSETFSPVCLRSNFKKKGITGTQILNQSLKKEEEKSSTATNRQTLILYQVCKINIRDY